MKRRLPIEGVTVASPEGDVEALQQALWRLGLNTSVDEEQLHDLHGRLAEVVGMWVAETNRLPAAPVARNLVRMGRSLIDAANTLRCLQGGIQHVELLETAQQLVKYLTLDPTVGSRDTAEQLLCEFEADASRIAHASLIAARSLAAESGVPGRVANDWYDAFTSLLLNIAVRANVQPALGRNGQTGKWIGWLIEAADALEGLLPKSMRSPSREARGRRLVRSRKRLEQREQK